jgi:hypothetical protein
MALNAAKSVHLIIIRSPTPFPSSYFIDIDVVPTQSSMKLLGLHVTGDLKWNDHVNSVCSKASKVLGMLHKCMRECKPKGAFKWGLKKPAYWLLFID